MKSVNVMTAALSELDFPKGLEIEKVNKSLIAQAVRVYRAAARQGNANTKTRGEVDGSTRKIYKQKGTGRARHGSIKAPVFVGGGIVHGPRTHGFDLDMPSTMRRRATLHALNMRKDEVTSAEGIAAYNAGTKETAIALQELLQDRKRTLIVLASFERRAFRTAVSNIKHVVTVPADELNAYDVMRYAHIVVENDAWAVLEKRLKASKE